MHAPALPFAPRKTANSTSKNKKQGMQHILIKFKETLRIFFLIFLGDNPKGAFLPAYKELLNTYVEMQAGAAMKYRVCSVHIPPVPVWKSISVPDSSVQH